MEFSNFFYNIFKLFKHNLEKYFVSYLMSPFSSLLL